MPLIFRTYANKERRNEMRTGAPSNSILIPKCICNFCIILSLQKGCLKLSAHVYSQIDYSSPPPYRNTVGGKKPTTTNRIAEP